MSTAAAAEREWLSVAQVADLTTYSEETIRRFVRRGELPASRRGGRRSGRGVKILISAEAVNDFFFGRAA